jgi:hypothetical protein
LHLFAEEVNAHSFSRKLLMRVLLEIIFFEQIVFEQSSRSFNEDFKVKSDYALKDTLSRKSTWNWGWFEHNNFEIRLDWSNLRESFQIDENGLKKDNNWFNLQRIF